MTDEWKLVVRTWKSRPPALGRPAVEETILFAAGPPLRISEARRRLMLLTNAACRGSPVVVQGEMGLVCLISLDDIVDIVMDPSPTLGEVMSRARSSS